MFLLSLWLFRRLVRAWRERACPLWGNHRFSAVPPWSAWKDFRRCWCLRICITRNKRWAHRRRLYQIWEILCSQINNWRIECWCCASLIPRAYQTMSRRREWLMPYNRGRRCSWRWHGSHCCFVSGWAIILYYWVQGGHWLLVMLLWWRFRRFRSYKSLCRFAQWSCLVSMVARPLSNNWEHRHRKDLWVRQSASMYNWHQCTTILKSLSYILSATRRILVHFTSQRWEQMT